MPIIQPPPQPPKKETIAVRLEERKLAELRRYGAFLETRNYSHIIAESLERVYRIDTEYKVWLKTHPDFAIAKKAARRNGNGQQPKSSAVSGAPAPSLVAAEDAASR